MSRITQGVGERAVVTKDEPQLESWVHQEAKPLLKQLRQAVNELDAAVTVLEGAIDDPATPTGPAGGQLGGTYPNPDVRGVRETAGPTLLTMGAVANGEFLVRSGSTVIGGTPPASAPGVTLRGFRSRDQGGAFVNATSRFHLAGYANSGGLFTQRGVQGIPGMGAGQMAYAIPEYFERAGVVNRLLIRKYGGVANAGTPRMRIGVYADGALAAGDLAGSPYPGALLGESASIDTAGANNRILESVGLSIAIAAGTRVWFVIMFNDQAITNQHNVPVFGYLHPILGFTTDPSVPTTVAQDGVTSGVGWRHAVTFGTTESFADPFPQTAPVIVVDAVLTGATAGVPAIFFGFQAT